MKMTRTALIIALAMPFSLVSTGIAAQTSKPNIVFILTDNLGYGEVGAYGGGITRGAPTPRIDSLAEEGSRYLNFNMETQCTPSRSSLMTGRWAIRSGTHSVPFGGVTDGLTRWEVTIGEALSDAGYATGYYGKWHLGSKDGRLPNDQGFDEWYGIPRTTDEALWPSASGWSADIMPPEQIMEGKKGEKSRELGAYDVVQRRKIDAEITRRTVSFIEKQAKADKQFFAYVALTQPHLPTEPNPEFKGKTGNGDWADMLAEMDAHVGDILDSIDKAGVKDNTIVVFTSDNGPEYIRPWDGWAGPWRGQYFTALEGGIRVPFMIRWPNKIPAKRVSNEILHGVDMFATLATFGGAKVPTDRPFDSHDQSDFILGKSEKSAREGFPIWCADRLQAVKWRNWKLHFYRQDNMFDPPVKNPVPTIFNLYTDPREEKPTVDTWVVGPVLKIVGEYQESLKQSPLIPMGTPDPYKPGASL
ncbi:Arylsulfatase [Pseudomonas marincola]|uniref:Arylsulfatase n=1 Tax=Pseudomonas marincola TaxID=437900 RepID=A0A653E4S2_9PSED|nr:arylsulfatase [Pseudomonas marincola]CAE6897861.1 Arylsulfatase [Pseudomonas marincola]